MDQLKTNTLTLLWSNLIRALQKVIHVENPTLDATKRGDLFNKIAAGEVPHWALPPITLYTQKVQCGGCSQWFDFCVGQQDR